MLAIRRLTTLRGAPYAVLALALAGTLAITWYVHRSLYLRDHARFEADADGVRHAIERRIDAHVTLIKATVGLFSASDSVSPAAFGRFVDRLEIETHYRGLRSIGYSARVPASGDTALVRTMRRDGYPDFHLWPAEPTADRQAVLYLQPLNATNRYVLGFDMQSRPDRRAAMDAARDSAQPVTSARLQALNTDSSAQPIGFLIYLPVYRGGAPPATVEERRRLLQGFVYAGFRTRDLFDALFRADSTRTVDLRIYDGRTTAPALLMYDSRATAGERGRDPAAEFVDTTTASVAGRPWAIVARSRPGYRSASMFWTALALLLGLLVSGALYVITRAQADAAADLRTSEARFRSLIEQSLLSTQVVRPDGRTVLVNRAWERLWGMTLDTLADFNLLTDPQLEAAGIVPLLRRAFAGEPVELPPLAYRPDRGDLQGIEQWVRAFAYPIRSDGGRVTEVVLVHEDISERREADERLRYQLDLLDAITTNAEDALFLMDAGGRVTFLNPAAERMFGWTRDELIGRELHEALHHRRPDGSPFPAADCGLGDVFRSGVTVRNHQDVFVRRDGTEMAVLCSNGPIVRDGRVTSAVLVVVDDTDRRQAEEARTRLAAIVESSEDAIIGKRLDGVIESWNHGAERIFGYAAAEMIGQSMLRLVPPERHDEEMDFLQRVSRGERVAHRDTVRVTSDGRRLDVAVSIFPVRAGGRIVGAATVMRDITEPKRREEALRHTQKLESIGVLAGGIAHDFNNLLTGIIGNASLALGALPPDTEAAELLGDVVRAGERAADLTNQLLAYAGKGRFFVAPVNVSQLVQGITRLILASIPKKVTLRVDTVPGLPPVEADASQLQQLVMNLVINGAESVGDAPGQVLVRTQRCDLDAREASQLYPEFDLRAGEYVELEVRDSGSGMDAATMRRIFDPFFTTKFMGRGLGLAAALGIVRSHRGGIRVASTPGQGTTFTVVLPATGRAPQRPTPSPAVERPTALAAGTILVVDDEDIVRQAAAATLADAGYTVVMARDGREAIQQVERLGEAVRLVLLDLTMPVMGGAEAFTRIRELRPTLPVIASSGYGESEIIGQFRGSGVSAFLQKPYTAARLRQVVADALMRV